MKRAFTCMFFFGMALVVIAAFKECLLGALAATLIYMVSFFSEERL